MHDHNFLSLATIKQPTPRGETLFRFLLINIPKIFKDFFACRIVLLTKHQYRGNIQRLSGYQAIFQRQPAIIQQSTTATNNSDQQQQPAKAIYNRNRERQPAFNHRPALRQPPATVRQTSARLITASVSYQFGS